MTEQDISFIIPVFNRPDEIEELLGSFKALQSQKSFEIVIVEDGSTNSCKKLVEKYNDELDVAYYYKENSGPGDSRNYGMTRAKGNYFIILDSDCLLPKDYLISVLNSLNTEYVDCFGGPDAAHDSFTNIQKAINFAMTSFISTGGVRGNKSSFDKFQPRSFNMGISKEAFNATQGFGRIHPGEDPDLSIRLWNLGYKTKLISEAYVFHKRRISWKKFYRQVYKFGSVRPILNKWHPQTKKITYWFPTLFCLGLIFSIILTKFGFLLPLELYALYFILAFLIALIFTKNLIVAMLGIFAICVQFIGYGFGFLKSTIKLMMSNKKAEEIFPNFFFKTNQ